MHLSASKHTLVKLFSIHFHYIDHSRVLSTAASEVIWMTILQEFGSLPMYKLWNLIGDNFVLCRIINMEERGILWLKQRAKGG